MRLSSALFVFIIAAMPAAADDMLDAALRCGIQAYADTQPPAGSWAQQLVQELREDVPPDRMVMLNQVKYLMISSQRPDGNIVRDERMGTFAHTVQTCLGGIPDQEVSAGELFSKADAILDVMYPVPEFDPTPMIELEKEIAERAAKRKVQ